MLTIDQLFQLKEELKTMEWNAYIDGASQYRKDVLPKMENVFADINARRQALEDELRKNGESLLRQHFTKLFAAVPTLQAVKWTQYTPYFNDGDACVFGVNEWSVRFETTPENAGWNEDGFEDVPWKSPDAKWKILAEFEGAVPESVLLATFGDHVEVTATREGFQVDEYSHD